MSFFERLFFSHSPTPHDVTLAERRKYKLLTVGDLLAADAEGQLRERPAADRGEQRRHERGDKRLDEVGEGGTDHERDGDVDDLACYGAVGREGRRRKGEREKRVRLFLDCENPPLSPASLSRGRGEGKIERKR